MSDRLKLSLLDLATVERGQSTADALRDSVALAQTAEQTGRFERIWYAEHHNMAQIASSATAVLIAHIAAHTQTIRLGSGGVMLPNHAPLIIAEQFGTLAELHPGRIDLGLGRAPGTDQVTVRALRRDPRASDSFAQDVQELAAFLGDEPLVPGVVAHPGRGTRVPLYILGSSLYGAHLAAALGLPYAFASHFAPDHLIEAVQSYRERFRPSSQLEHPYVIAACNVVVAQTTPLAEQFAAQILRSRVRSLAERVPAYKAIIDQSPDDDDLLEELLDTPVGMQARQMLHYSMAGDVAQVGPELRAFAELAQADEVMVTDVVPGLDNRLRALELIGQI